MKLEPITSSFFQNKPTTQIAQELLGKYIVHKTQTKTIIGQITETEAYLHNDPASHSFKGKTKRNASMFEKEATAYIYTIYGMYECFNIVTNKKGIGEAVLIRAIKPIQNITQKSDGPAKLVQALKITKEHNGINLLTAELTIMHSPNEPIPPHTATPRIGISKATDKLYRYLIVTSDNHKTIKSQHKTPRQT